MNGDRHTFVLLTVGALAGNDLLLQVDPTVSLLLDWMEGQRIDPERFDSAVRRSESWMGLAVVAHVMSDRAAAWHGMVSDSHAPFWKLNAGARVEFLKDFLSGALAAPIPAVDGVGDDER